MKNILIKITSIISLVAGFIFQAFVFCQIYPGLAGNPAYSGQTLIIFYAAGTLLMGYGFYFFYDKKKPLLWAAYIMPVLFIPFYGVFGSLVAAFYNFFSKNMDYSDYLDDSEMLTPSDEYWSGEDSSEIIRSKKWAQSYFDIMTGDNKNLKKLLLQKIMDENILYGAKLLNIALKDKDYEIRSFAAVVLNKLDNDINQKIMSAKRRMHRDPEDVQVRLDLVRMYYSYCANGLTDAGTFDYYMGLASSLLDELDQQDTLSKDGKLEVLLWKARIAKDSGDRELEGKIYNEILSEYPDHADTLANSCALDFSKRDFKKLTDRCRQWKAAEPQSNPLSEAINTWIGES